MSYHKALVDIISMVKHAARDDEPLYTARTKGESSDDEDNRRPEDLRPSKCNGLSAFVQHLIENLSVDQSDFDALPIFNRYGGWARANRVFEGELPDLLKQFNEGIAA